MSLSALLSAVAALWKKLNALPPKPFRARAPSVQAACPVALPLRYLIACEEQFDGKDGEIVEVGYYGRKPLRGRAIRYCNLYDQTGSGKYRPYLDSTDTASAYDERVVDPHGAGWVKLLRDQCDSARRADFREIEWDNPDGYSQRNVLEAVSYAASQGLKVWAKNPLGCSWDATLYVAHPAVCGVIVERGAGSPADMDALRRGAGKPDLPVRFVAFRSKREDGRAWAGNTAHAAQQFKNMGVTFSADGEYTGSADLLLPR